MNIFGTIMSKIFGHHAETASAATTPAMPGATIPVATSAPATQAPMSAVDVEAVLTDLASQYSHAVNWRYSIVDLMAILKIDNSLAQRKALAKELAYTGDMSDSATMNTWLHKQVMTKLAENGGRVPAELTN